MSKDTLHTWGIIVFLLVISAFAITAEIAQGVAWIRWAFG